MCKIIKHTEVQQYICICNQILCVCVLETLLSTQLNIVAVFGPHVIVKLYPKMCKIAKHSVPIYTENWNPVDASLMESIHMVLVYIYRCRFILCTLKRPKYWNYNHWIYLYSLKSLLLALSHPESGHHLLIINTRICRKILGLFGPYQEAGISYNLPDSFQDIKDKIPNQHKNISYDWRKLVKMQPWDSET